MAVYTVTQVARYVRELLELDGPLSDLWVKGEVSNFSRSPAGHSYFTLKDAESQLRCVLFRSFASPAELRDGLAVLAHGHVSFYEVRGELQYYVDQVQPEGEGLLRLELERLKARLEREGLFAPERKRPLPVFPRRIGLVTSPIGAVFHDIVNIISRRFPPVELVLSPTPVQGDEAAPGIVLALDSLNALGDIDVIILARGGGSLEELWPFNEEEVARAVYRSRAPVISGVGHQTDFTIADLVADVRAPTPSAAAELAVPDQEELRARLGACHQALKGSASHILGQQRLEMERWRHHLEDLAPDLASYRQRCDDLIRRAAACWQGRHVGLRREQVRSLGYVLASLSPQSVLARGYAVVQDAATRERVWQVAQARLGQGLDIRVSDGWLQGQVTGKEARHG